MTPLPNNQKLLIVKLIIIFAYGISIPGLWTMRDNPSAFQLSWVFTTLTLIFLLLFHKPFCWKFSVSLVAVGIAGWLVEAIGTNTGIIFGGYTYGQSLGFKVFGTPLSMAVNWMISVYMVAIVLKYWFKNIWMLGLIGALLMVLYDILLEPVAIRLDMWSWDAGTPPIQNYVAWFVVSFPLVVLLGRYVKKAENPLAALVLVCQILFFGILNLMISFAGF